MTEPRILLVEDDPGDARMVEAFLGGGRWGRLRLDQARTLAAALERLEAAPYDLVILDLGLPDSHGLDTFRAIRERFPKVGLIILTGGEFEAHDITAMKSGVQDYILKDEGLHATLARSVRFALERHHLVQEREEAVAARLESDRRFRHLLESIHLFAITLDPAGRITFCNEHLLWRAGYSAHEVVGRDWFERFTPPEAHRRAWYEAALAAGDLPTLTEADLVLAGGEVRRVKWNNATLRDAKGRILGTASIGEDITDRRQAERALRQSEEQYRTLIERLHEGVAKTDAEGRITYANPRMRQMLGYGEGDPLPGTLRILASQPRSAGGVERRERGRRGWRSLFEARLTRRDGGLLEALMSESPLKDARGAVVGELVMVTDNSARKRSQELLRRAQKGESLARMAGGIAHDFNNLFQALQTSLELARNQIRDPVRLEADLDRALGLIGRAAELSALMLDYSGKGFLRTEGLDLGELIRAREGCLRDMAGPSCPLACVLEADLPRVEGDPHQLAQVVAALVCNAAEASGPGPRPIHLSVRRQAIGPGDLARGHWPDPPLEGEYVALAVQDEGGGIPAEHLEQIFDPFFTTKAIGRGLGLSAALGILRAHHAFLQVDSTPGVGTCMRIFFPPRPGFPGSSQDWAPGA